MLAVVGALALGGAGGGAAPSVTTPAAGMATDPVIGGGAGRAFEVVDELDAQIRELEEEAQAVEQASSAGGIRLDADFFDTSL